MTSGADHWWDVPWEMVRPGDDVRAPDGSVWTVVAAIDFPDAKTRELAIAGAGGASAWTSRRPAETVTARRLNLGPVDVMLAVDILRYAGFEVEPL